MMDMVIRFCEIAIMVISIIFLSWVGVSFLEIVTHNIEMEDYVLSGWNFFAIWFEMQLFQFPPLKKFRKIFAKLFSCKIFPKLAGVLYNCQEERSRVVEDGFKKFFLKKKKFPLDKS